MAASQHTDRLREEVTCSVCLEYLSDPVCIQCGHNFCRACITRCWQGPGVAPLCPQCRTVCTGRALHPNVGLRNIVEVIRGSSTPRAELCPRHQQRLQLFCETDLQPICVVCDRSHRHRCHSVLPVEEAAEECKVTLNYRIKQLSKELESLQNGLAEESRTATELERNFKIQTVKIVGIFEHLKLFLEKEKKQLLTRLEKEHEVYMKVIKGKVSALEKQQATHRSLILELEEMCRMEDLTLLKGMQNILSRCDDVKPLKPVEDVTLLPTVQRIQHVYMQEKFTELEKTLPAELDPFISGCQMHTTTFDCMKRKLDDICSALEISSQKESKKSHLQTHTCTPAVPYSIFSQSVQQRNGDLQRQVRSSRNLQACKKR